MPMSKTKMKNAAIAAKSAALPKISKELLDQFVSGPMTGEAVNADSGHWTWRSLNGRSSMRRTQHPDPKAKFTLTTSDRSQRLDHAKRQSARACPEFCVRGIA